MIAIDKNGHVMEDAIVIEEGTVVEERFRVRVISGEVVKKVVGEMDFKEFPSEMQILFCIRFFRGDFATVEKIFIEDHIPFAKGD